MLKFSLYDIHLTLVMTADFADSDLMFKHNL